MRILLPSLLLFAAGLSAQESPAPATDPLAAGKQRLQAALHKAATQTDTAFTAKWGPTGKQQDPVAQFLIGRGGGAVGALQGSWHQGRTRYLFDGENGDELVLAGQRMIAKDGTTDWRLRDRRFADGNPVGFLPDVPLLLSQLATLDLDVKHRSVGSLDDRPIEILGVTLRDEQVAEAIWTGLVPASLCEAMGGGVFMLAGGNAAAKRPPAPTPTATVDLAISLDPATGVVHQLQFRAWTKEDARMGNIRIVRAGGGVQVANGGEAAADEDDKDDPAPDAPLVYENGLPKRPRKKMSVADYTIRLQQHGKATPPESNDRQKLLLGH